MHLVKKQKKASLFFAHLRVKASLPLLWCYLVYVLMFSDLSAIRIFRVFSSERKVACIYTILARSILHIYAEWLYNYTFIANSKKCLFLPFGSIFRPPILNIRSFVPKLPPKNSWISTGAQLRTDATAPKLPRIFRIGWTENLFCDQLSSPPSLHPYAYLCGISLVT